MKLDNQHIALRAAIYVSRLLISRQPKNRVFPNLHHTLTVFEGAGKIGQAERLSEDDLEVVSLAAIFHDSGHIECHQGHEKVSARIASEWLEGQNYPSKIGRVMGCIKATTEPQKPRDRFEKFDCDADFWMNLQKIYELDLARLEVGVRIALIPQRS